MDNKGSNGGHVFPFIPQTWVTGIFFNVERLESSQYGSLISLTREAISSTGRLP